MLNVASYIAYVWNLNLTTCMDQLFNIYCKYLPYILHSWFLHVASEVIAIGYVTS